MCRFSKSIIILFMVLASTSFLAGCKNSYMIAMKRIEDNSNKEKRREIYDNIYVKEIEEIKDRRIESKDTKDLSKTNALCLSGGGVRSASFNLGVLKGLHEIGILNSMDYLSTVSGGSYIAAWYMVHNNIENDILLNTKDWLSITKDSYDKLGKKTKTKTKTAESGTSKKQRDLQGDLYELTILRYRSDYLRNGEGLAKVIPRILFGYGVTIPQNIVFNFIVDLDWNIDGLPFYKNLSLRGIYREKLAVAYLQTNKDKKGTSLYLPDLTLESWKKLTEKFFYRPYWILNGSLDISHEFNKPPYKVVLEWLSGKYEYQPREYLPWEPKDVEKKKSFEMSPLFCGSDAIGYVESDKKHDWMRLDYSLGISGSAVSARSTDNRLVQAAIYATNSDLGYFIKNWKANWNQFSLRYFYKKENWRYLEKQGKWLISLPLPLYKLFYEGHERNLKSKYLFVSDGGHFDNLGAYPVILRGCDKIIICDAEQDQESLKWDKENFFDRQKTFGALLILRKRLKDKFGKDVEVYLDHDSLTTYPSSIQVTTGTVANIPDPATGELKNLELYYIKAALSESHYKQWEKNKTAESKNRLYRFFEKPAEAKDKYDRLLEKNVYPYKELHPEFPQQSTLDQLFSNRQFDAYFYLGYVAVMKNKKAFSAFEKINLTP